MYFSAPNSRGSGYISLTKDDTSRRPSNQEENDSEDDENRTIVMTGTRSENEVKKESFKNAGEYHGGDDDHQRWEGNLYLNTKDMWIKTKLTL